MFDLEPECLPKTYFAERLPRLAKRLDNNPCFQSFRIKAHFS
jgi:hypothetical protein